MRPVRFGILCVVVLAAVVTVRDIARSVLRGQRPAFSAGEVEGPRGGEGAAGSRPAGEPVWQARHEGGDLEEYSWWRVEGSPTGAVQVVPDPTGRGRGFVLKAEIEGASPPGADSHRLYPVLLLSEGYRGAYRSSFRVWADVPPGPERGWFSFATYSNKRDWKDLFGVNLGFEQGEDRLVLFHVPEFGKGDYHKISIVPFPLRRWVTVEVRVDEGGILLFQDGRLIAEAAKAWGPEGVGLWEAHWGLYAQGKNRRGVVLNDDVSLVLDRPFAGAPRKVRGGAPPHDP